MQRYFYSARFCRCTSGTLPIISSSNIIRGHEISSYWPIVSYTDFQVKTKVSTDISLQLYTDISFY